MLKLGDLVELSEKAMSSTCAKERQVGDHLEQVDGLRDGMSASSSPASGRLLDGGAPLFLLSKRRVRRSDGVRSRSGFEAINAISRAAGERAWQRICEEMEQQLGPLPEFPAPR